MRTTTRQCTKCYLIKSLAEFSLAPRGLYGRKANCKACDARRHAKIATHVPHSETRARYQANADRRLAAKRCRGCGESKDSTGFAIVRQGKYGPILDSRCVSCREVPDRPLCACGCGERVKIDTRRGRASKYLSGHNSRVTHPMAGNSRHNMEGTKTYRTWVSMLDRCANPNSRSYARYGGRGITVCNRWYDFVNFLADMGEKPEGPQRMTIDRIDNDGNYEPGNCRWATYSDQAHNRSNTKLTPESAAAIRADPRSSRAITRDHGISAATVIDVKIGRRWKAADSEAREG